MNKDVARREVGQSLFRPAAVKAAGYRLFGGIAVVAPPSATIAVAISALVLIALAVVLAIVEVPQRTRAVGVLMPSGGLLDVVANESGFVKNVFVSQGDALGTGDLILTISGGGASAHGESVSQMKLLSLQNELALLNNARSRQQDISSDKLLSLQLDIVAANKRLETGEARLHAYQEEISVLETRFARWQSLVSTGHIARDAFDLERAEMVKARAVNADFVQSVADSLQDVAALGRSRTEVQKQIELRHVEHELATSKVQREIDLEAYEVAQDLRASKQGIVARVLVRAGDAVRPGQVLARLRGKNEQLEAWLYLPTTSARLLRIGQEVEIRLDAYPQQMFGTFSATVAYVSGVALLPGEVSAPLTLATPVFEIRAVLSDNSVRAYGENWPLSPGTSFQADIIQRRYRLYEWILRTLAGRKDGANA